MNLLQNKTVCLRAPEPEDLELLYSWENNPEWWEIGNTLAPYSRYLLKEYIAESHRGIFAIAPDDRPLFHGRNGRYAGFV